MVHSWRQELKECMRALGSDTVASYNHIQNPNQRE